MIKTIKFVQGAYSEEGKSYRSKAKGIQLGLTYGMGAKRLANTLEVSFDEADKILKDFFATYRNVSDWIKFNDKKLKTYGFMETVLGRRRRLPDVFLLPAEVLVYDQVLVDDIIPNMSTYYLKMLNRARSDEETNAICSLNNWKKKEAQKERLRAIGYEVIDNGAFISRTSTQCTNSVIQGGAADMTKLAMLEIFNSKILNKHGAKLRFLVHDEIIVEGPVQFANEIAAEFVDCMVRAPAKMCKVRMACDKEVETRWKLGHLCGNIRKTASKKGTQAVYDYWYEFNREDLDRIINNTFDPNTEELRTK